MSRAVSKTLRKSSMANPKVSVVIPAYNAIAYLPKTITSALQQSFQDFEIVVVDDGSTDGTCEWAASLADSRIRAIAQSNGGCASARNRGIRETKGDYIAFLDADDIWEPEKLEKQARVLDSYPSVGLVNTWISNIDGQGQPIEKLGKPTAEGQVWASVIEENPVMCGSAPMVRRQCFEAVGEFDETVPSAEDWDMWIRIAKQYEFAVVKEPLVRYRIHTESSSHNLKLHLQSRLSVIEKSFQDGFADEIKGGSKNRAYGLSYLSVAYRALQNDDIDQAYELKNQSVRCYSALQDSKAFRRLGTILFLRRYLGDGRYKRLLKTLKYVSAQIGQTRG